MGEGIEIVDDLKIDIRYFIRVDVGERLLILYILKSQIRII